jgi:hypothetical protein
VQLWALPNGWTLHTESEPIETTRGGGPPDYVFDMVRTFIPGPPMAWLESPAGQRHVLPIPFTLDDIETVINQERGI